MNDSGEEERKRRVAGADVRPAPGATRAQTGRTRFFSRFGPPVLLFSAGAERRFTYRPAVTTACKRF